VKNADKGAPIVLALGCGTHERISDQRIKKRKSHPT